MKRLSITLSLLLFTFIVSLAELVSEQKALATAKQFMQGKELKPTSVTTLGSRAEEDQPSFYIFNADEAGGFVIVSADDRTIPILGYSDRGQLDPFNLPPNVKWLLDYYKKSISSLPDSSTDIVSRSNDRPEIPVLIDTQWGQGEPYNSLCPRYENKRCVTGCVATAMAQVINYHRWPQAETSNISAYVTEGSKINMPELPPRKFDWENMTDHEVAELMRYCGQSIKIDYWPYASSAFEGKVVDALINNFGYSKGISYLWRENFDDDEWAEMIYDELSQKHPIQYYGWHFEIGHAFILDGYKDGLYHINWGWSGYCDGYFNLRHLNPYDWTDEGYNYMQKMIVNVCPPAESDISRPKAIVREMNCSNRSLERAGVNESFPPFKVTSVVESDMIADLATLQIGLGLYYDNGLVKVLWQDTYSFTYNESHTFEEELTIDESLPIGDYKIIAINRLNDNDQWMKNIGSPTVYIAMTVGETNLQLRPMPLSEEEKNIIEFGTHTIDGITYRLYSEFGNNRADILLHNETEQYKGEIYIPDYVNYMNMQFVVWRVPYNEGREPFCNNEGLTSISTSISNNMSLVNCPNLKNIEFREGTTDIFLIGGCDALESICFPSSVQAIWGLNSNKNLKSITFTNKSLISLWFSPKGEWSIESMPSLTDIYFYGEIPPRFRSEDWDPEINPNVTIHVPKGTADAYEHSEWNGWKFVDDLPGINTHVKLDYCGDLPPINVGGFGIGFGDSDVEVAIRIPHERISPYINCKITAIEYYTTELAWNEFHSQDCEYVFITTPGVSYLTKQAVKTIRGTWTRIELETPYTITGEELFVGVGRNHEIEMHWANSDIVEDGFWGRVVGGEAYGGIVPGEWYKAFGFANWRHPLSIRAVIEGVNLPTDVEIANIEIVDNTDTEMYKAAVKPDATQSILNDTGNGEEYYLHEISPNGAVKNIAATAPKSSSLGMTRASNGDSRIKIKLRNRTPHLVKHITLDWSINGKLQKPIYVETALLTNHDEVVTVDIPREDLSGRIHTIDFNVSEIDGVPDEIQANSSVETSLQLTGGRSRFPRKIVMEDATSAASGFGPRDIAIAQKMEELHPDNFIAIGVHRFDEMEMSPNNYSALTNLENVVSYPYAHINRSFWWTDEYVFDIDEMKDSGEALINADATFVESGQIEVNTETIFGFNEEGFTEYRIAYVLTENGVGPYTQTNYYSNPVMPDRPDDIFNWWYHQEPEVEMTFDNVARSIYNYDGIPNQLPTVFREGETIKSTHTIDIPNNVQDVDNLMVVTLLLDTRTGEIINADRTTISGTPPAGLTDIINEPTKSFDVYNMLGIKVRNNVTSTDGLPAGIYIVNGRKVLVK